MAMVAHLVAWAGDPRATEYIEKVAATHPGEASMLTGFLRARQGRFTEAADAIEAAYLSLRTDPWMMSPIVERSYEVALYVAAQDKAATSPCASTVRSNSRSRFTSLMRIAGKLLR
jgi:hypothetical protein